MLLDSIQTLSAYPFEHVGVWLNTDVAPQLSARMGVRFRSNIFDYSPPLLKWGNNGFTQVGNTPDLLNSIPLSSYYDADYTDFYVQSAINYVDVPGDFPIFLETSAVFGNNILLNFAGGTSAITIYPSTPYPVIQQIDNYQMSVSGGFFALSAFDYNLPASQFHQQVDMGSISPLTNQGGTNIKFAMIPYSAPGGPVNLFPDAYISGKRENYVFLTQSINNSTSTPLQNKLIDHNIIPKTLQLSFPVMSAGLSSQYLCVAGYSNTIGNGVSYLSSGNLQSLSVPILQSATLDATNSKLNLKLSPGYYVPGLSEYTISYETSGLPYIKSAVAGTFRQGVTALESNNYYVLSAQNAPYLYDYKFSVKYNSAKPTEEAFTISFHPEFITTQTQSSAFLLSANMVDNFYQTSFPIVHDSKVVRLRYFEENDDLSLSAIDQLTNKVYKQNQWMPASACLRFVNDGLANSFGLTFDVSANNNSLYNTTIPRFILNKEKAFANLSIGQFTDNFAVVEGSIFPNFDPSRNVTWTIDPPNNIELFQFNDQSDIFVDQYDTNTLYFNPPVAIPIGSPTLANTMAVVVNKLGVDNTTITMYSEEFGLSASTIWYPPSSVYNNAQIMLSGNVNDMNPIRTTSLSALFLKNNLLYPAPDKGSIIWRELNNDPRGSSVFHPHTLSSIIFEDVIYPASQYTNVIDTVITTDKAVAKPETIIFNYSANSFGNKSDQPLADSYNTTNTLPIYVRQYPDNTNIYMAFTASNGDVFDSHTYESKFFTNSSLMLTAQAISSDFSSIHDGIYWNIPGNTSFLSGAAAFPLSAISSSYCVEVSAFNAQPINTNFKPYNFTDKLCFYVLPSSYPSLDYISFPQYNLFPTLPLAIDEDLSYLNSVALTGLFGCITNVTVSTFGGFDDYIYQIGSKIVESSNNVVTIPVTDADISGGGMVSISAFNTMFPKGNPMSFYNYASSDNSDALHQAMSSVMIPALSAQFSISNNLMNLRDVNSNMFTLNLEFPFEGLAVETGTFNFILSSPNEIRYSDPITFSNAYTSNNLFTLNQHDFFSIKRNTYVGYTLAVSGNITKMIDNAYPCRYGQYFLSDVVTLSAYDGPDITIYTPLNISTTNNMVSVFNETAIFPSGLDSFIFSDGNGHVTSGYTNTSVMTALYASEGTYSISITAIPPIDPPIIKVFPDLFVIKNTFDQYDSNINRTFPESVVLPYTSDQVRITPNAWQWDNPINDSLTKLHANFLALSSSCFSYDINVPKNVIGWIGEKNGDITWNYETPPVVPYSTDTLTNLKDIVQVGDKFAIINGTRIELRNNDYNLSLVNYTDRLSFSYADTLPKGELLTNPTNIAYIPETNKIAVLDNIKNNIYIYELDDSNRFIFTHYWGGEGEKSSRTKLNDPVDLYYSNGNLFVVDSSSANVKIYNSFLNWTNQISHPTWDVEIVPVSITSSDDEIYVLTNIGVVYVFNNSYVFLRYIHAQTGSKIYHSNNIKGLLHIVADNQVFIYTINGIYVNVYAIAAPISKLLFIGEEIYALNSFSIIKLIDYIGLKSIIGSPNFAIPLDAILVNPDEPVTDFIYNDSFLKLHSNLLALASNIDNKFVIYLDEFDKFLSHDIESIHTDERSLSASSYIPLGLNELVVWETINRSIDNVTKDIESLHQMVDVRTSRIANPIFNWTWKSMSIDKSQNVNDNRRPFSWKELQSASTVFDSVLSGITWKTAMRGGWEANNCPINWVWEQMSDNCIWPITWEQLEQNQPLARTWEDVANNCSDTPIKTFDKCVDVCG